MALQAERDGLLEKMLSAVTSVQIKYGGHSGLAVEQDSSVAYMCRSIEDVLLHRVKYRKNIVANIIKDDEDILMWDLITRFMTKSEVSRFESEKSLKSGMARVRSWIRSALNDGLLEKYLSSLNKADVALLRNYYHNDAFMLDAPLTGALPDICAGLSSVLFSFDLDKEEFNQPLRRENTPEALRDNTPPASPQKVTIARQHSKLKKKMSRAHIMELPDVTDNERKRVITEAAVDVSRLAARLIPDSVESDFDFKSISMLVCDKESDSDDEDSFRARLTTDGQGIRIVPKPPSIKRKPNVIEEEVVTSSDEDDRDTLKTEDIPIEQPTTLSSCPSYGLSVPNCVSPAISASHLMGTNTPQMLEHSFEIGTILDQSIEGGFETGEDAQEVLTPPTSLASGHLHSEAPNTTASSLTALNPTVFEPLKEFVQAVEKVKETLPEASESAPVAVPLYSVSDDTVSVEGSTASDTTEEFSGPEVTKGEPTLFLFEPATPERTEDIGAMFEGDPSSSLLEDSTDGQRSSSVLEELPRSSSVISKPYSPVAADIVARRLEAMRRLSLGPPSARMPPEGQSSSKGTENILEKSALTLPQGDLYD